MIKVLAELASSEACFLGFPMSSRGLLSVSVCVPTSSAKDTSHLLD